jgi:phosphopantetheinyl transferase
MTYNININLQEFVSLQVIIMPLLRIEHINDHVSYGLWKIEENADFLLKNVFLSKEEKIEYKRIQHVKRKKEWLSARATLLSLCKELDIKCKGTVKDDNNKPHLIGVPSHISISHSFPYALVLLNKKAPCGIDIEKAKPAFFHVSSKFLNETEIKQIPRDPQHLCAAWAAKEVLYKLHGRGKISFKNNLFLSPYELKDAGEIEGHIKLDMGTGNYLIKYFQLDDFIICYSI